MLTHITLDLLKRHRACKDQQHLFVSTFGESAELTDDSLAKALAVGLNVLWLTRLLPAAARAEYERIRASARAEYERIAAAAWAEHERIAAAASAEYERIRASARVEYQRIEAQTVVNLLRGV